jgi:hypothetical protein
MPDGSSTPVIRASELGQHAFCARSWWLARVQGYPSAHSHELSRGREAHHTHGRGVLGYQLLLGLACALFVIAGFAAALGAYSLVRGL